MSPVTPETFVNLTFKFMEVPGTYNPPVVH